MEEGVTSQVYGELSSTVEVREGAAYLERLTTSLRERNINAEKVILHSNNPAMEIVKYAKSLQPDLVVMGAHGHKGLKDIVFGATINSVRHDLSIPFLIVRGEK